MTTTVAWQVTFLAVSCLAGLSFAFVLSRARLATTTKIIDGLDDALIVTDSAGLIEYCNFAASQMIGLGRQVLLNQSVHTFVNIDAEESSGRSDKSWPLAASLAKGSISSAGGDHTPVMVRCNAIRGRGGEIDGYALISTRLVDLLAAQKRVDRLSLVDTVTGLPNIVVARSRLAYLMANNGGDGERVDFFVVQLHRLDSVNSVYGLTVGDSILQIVGERLADIFADQFVCHLGCGRFVGLAATTDEHYGFSLALLVSDATARSIRVDERDFELGFSVGLSSYPADGDSFDRLLEQARVRSASSDDFGDNEILRGKDSTGDDRWRSSRIELELASACRTSQFRLVYQPQVDLLDSHVVGMEALIRWDHPQWGRLGPEEFIAIAERSGQISLIDDWVIREVCRQRRSFLDQGIWDVPIAVNIATTDLNDSGFESKLARTLDEFCLTPEFLELELMEKSLLQLGENAALLLNRLRRLGVRIALDDFGTGYCNLANLKTLPVDRIKIDREFVQSLPGDEADAVVCKTVIELAKFRQLDVVAEGVETAAQAQFLRGIGCDYAQGFLWSPPLDIAMLSPRRLVSTKRMVEKPENTDPVLDMEATGIWRVS